MKVVVAWTSEEVQLLMCFKDFLGNGEEVIWHQVVPATARQQVEHSDWILDMVEQLGICLPEAEEL